MQSPAIRFAKSIASSNPIPGGCVLYLPLWNPACWGTTFKTIDPYGHLCTRVGGTMDGSGFVADGDDYINMNPALTPLAATTVGTWMTWVKFTDATPAASFTDIIAFGDTNANTILDLLLMSNGHVRAEAFKVGAGQWQLETTNAVISDGVSAHIALIHNGTSPIILINGVQVAQTFIIVSVDETAWFSDLPGLDNGRIGCRNINNAGNTGFIASGAVGEVVLSNRVYTTPDVLYCINATKGRFL